MTQTRIPVYTFREIISESVSKFGQREAYTVKTVRGKTPEESEYRHVTYEEFGREVRALGTALIDEFGIGAHIALTGENRYEWCLSYLAITTSGCVAVPVDKDLSPAEMKVWLTQSHSAGIIYAPKVYEKSLGEALKLMESEGSAPIKTISMEQELADLLSRGNGLLEGGDSRYDSVVTDPEALSVLIFTSGTTGVSKGVMLSQKNICSDIFSVMQCLEHTCEDSMLSMLPLHHTYECTCSFLVTFTFGGRLSFCEGTRYIAKNIQEYSPTIVMMVPLILENIYGKMTRELKKSRLKWISFRFLMGLARFLRLFGIEAGRKFFKQAHESLGGKLRLIVAGAAPMSPKVLKELTGMGFKVRQGYGLTECSPILCVTREKLKYYASVGPAMPGVTVKIDNPDDEGNGEILAKGDNIMLGYYENPEATANAFTEDGWFRTGDRGHMDKDGSVFVTGRIKNMIVNKTGKNIYPEELEAKLLTVPYIKECVVWGDNDSSDEDTVICVTLVPNATAIAEKTDILPDDTAGIEALIWKEIKRINRDLPTYKRIQRLEIRTKEFEKTTTSKVKRYILNLTGKGKKQQ